MGCGSSKLKKSSKCNSHCKPPLSSSVSTSYSKLVHHPPSKEGDSYHVVALTSSTLGSLSLDRSQSPPTPIGTKPMPYYSSFNGRLGGMEPDFEMDMTEAKAWSKMIDQRIPKSTPSPPPGEPETINAWEMMEGLEEEEVNTKPQVSSHSHSHINNVSPNEIEMPAADVMAAEDEDEDCLSNAKDGDSTEFDTKVISAFRKALGELSPTNPFHLPKLQQPPSCNIANNHDNIVEDLNKVNGDNVVVEVDLNKDRKALIKEKLVLYFTSLRGIRKTYEDCCDVKLIFKGLGVRVDERDVSMHSAFKDELRGLLAAAGDTQLGCSALPRVFIEDRYIGGADDIRRMDEEGTLIKHLRRCEFFEDQSNGCLAGRTCEACGEVRFVPCETCSGSCKVYYEADEEEEDQLEEDDEFGFHRCPDCNENGLIRCPLCCQ